MSEKNVDTIKAIYGAFGRGDVAAILDRLDDHAVFAFNVAKSDVPWHATYEGKRDIPKFFQALGEGTQVHAFEADDFVHSGPHVVVAIRFEHTLRKSGRRVSERQLHFWTFRDDGKVAGITHYADTAAVIDAYRG
jgi:ketosteroid isomerase-like protein